jgi:hypothetical protein
VKTWRAARASSDFRELLRFEAEVLSKSFKSNQMSSFVRQLNFCKSRSTAAVGLCVCHVATCPQMVSANWEHVAPAVLPA